MAESTEKKVSFVERAKGFYHKHEKACKVGGALLVCAGMFVLGKHVASSGNTELPAGDSGETKALPESKHDFGEDMTMRFYYDKDGSELGNGVAVSEEFARDFVGYDAEHRNENGSKEIVA